MPWFLLAGVLLFALNLRGPIVALAPVLEQLRLDLGLSSAAAGLLTSLPVLCFALVTPLAAVLIKRAGPEQAVLISLLGILIGTLVRAMGGFDYALVGTIVIGAAITIGNVVVPVIVRRDFPAERVGHVTGTYTATLNIGAMITSLLTAPLAEAIGWRAAITAWAVLVIVAIVVWGQAAGWRRTVLGERSRTAKSAQSARVPHAAAWRSLTTWILTLAFAGQAFSYYGLTAWLPTILVQTLGMTPQDAGTSSSAFQIFAVVGALGVPLLAGRWRPSRLVALITLLWLTAPVGLVVHPEAWLLWTSLAGAAQGGGVTIVFILIVRIARTNDQARGLSAFVQGCGYAIAAAGPFIIGAVHQASDDWIAPMYVLAASVLVLGVCGVAAGVRAEARHPESPEPRKAATEG
jgi:CP family cyanate transporter-like MFS transporter